jgi:hypothetical protein
MIKNLEKPKIPPQAQEKDCIAFKFMDDDTCEEIMEKFLNKAVKNLPSVIDEDA